MKNEQALCNKRNIKKRESQGKTRKESFKRKEHEKQEKRDGEWLEKNGE